MRIYLMATFLNLSFCFGQPNKIENQSMSALKYVINSSVLKEVVEGCAKDTSNISYVVNDTLRKFLDFPMFIGLINEVMEKDSTMKFKNNYIVHHNNIIRKFLTKEDYKNANKKESIKWEAYKQNFKPIILNLSKKFNSSTDPDVSIYVYPYINNILIVRVFCLRNANIFISVDFTFFFDEESNIYFVSYNVLEC